MTAIHTYRKCRKCHFINYPHGKRCQGCGRPLDNAIIVQKTPLRRYVAGKEVG